ncbi:leucine-rich repeat protein [Ruminococcus flavefaciens]|uniref:Leucine rich repeat-containing protein n=1 Tax=Ruminococcus flavefaciens TaxID=1265 RepID=A0A1M7G791_RUMFL|nr:leucine-rich repeat protein [Ruminococcus flavefaciens]SHM12150.1 Leucine rich repeat-containing protein [Ruminococcus flavefaciens]
MKIKGFISILAALAVITGSGANLPVAVAAEVVSEAESTAEYDLDAVSKNVEKDGVLYALYNGYAAVELVNDNTIEEFTVPETINNVPVVGIKWGAFRNCSKIKKLTLTKNVSVMEWSDVAEQTMEEIAVTEDNEAFTVEDGILYSKDMKTVVAFPPSNSAAEIKIADKAEKIAPYAFIACHNLTKIEVSNNVREIGAGAFAGCINLTSVNIPDGVQKIEQGTFIGTKALKDLKIPGSVENIYFEAFRDTGAVVVEDGIHYVDKWAVGADDDIDRADIRMGTVGTIEGLFSGKNKLKVITVPASVSHVGRYLAFGIYMPLELVVFNCPVIPAGCIGCPTVKEVWINDPDCKIEDHEKSIPAYWREPKEDPDSKTDIDEENDYTVKHTRVASANVAANSIQKAINTSLVELDEDIDQSSTTITKIEHYMEKAKKINQNTEDTSASVEAQPVEKVYSAPIKIGNPAKYDTIIRGHKGSTAEEYALKYKRVFDPFVPAVAVVGPDIVEDMDNGVDYWIYGENFATAQISSGRVTYGKEVPKEITIPETVKGATVKTVKVFQGKSDIVHIPATVENYVCLVDAAEDGIAYYDVAEDNPYLTSVDGIIYSKDMTKLIKVPSRYAGKKIVVPDTVKSIENFAFFSLDNVESIELPNDIEVISRCAFSGCDKLVSVNMPEKLGIISDNAFNGCTALKNVTIPDSVYYVGYNAFHDTSLVEFEKGLGYKDGWLVEVEHGNGKSEALVNIKEGTTGVAAIYANTDITLPKTVTKMSWGMIEGSDRGLRRADVYSHVLDYDAFVNAWFLKDIYIYDPECEICAGDQTMRAKHYEYADELVEYREGGYHEQYTDARTLANELNEIENSRVLEDTVIHGYEGSTAEAYAKMYGLKFEAMDDTNAYKNGDLNGDGQFNVGDLVLMNRYIHGTYTFNEKQFKSADLNGDGNADVFDVIEFRKRILAD